MVETFIPEGGKSISIKITAARSSGRCNGTFVDASIDTSRRFGAASVSRCSPAHLPADKPFPLPDEEHRDLDTAINVYRPD
jgi:hypothetical protein